MRLRNSIQTLRLRLAPGDGQQAAHVDGEIENQVVIGVLAEEPDDVVDEALDDAGLGRSCAEF